MAKYDDLYIRSTLNDPGNIPRTRTGLSASPDIIPYGIMPVNNPVQFFTNNFQQIVSKDLVYNAPNYVYLRGRNQFNGAQTGKMYAYYAPSSLLLYPSQWKENSLYTQSGTGEQNFVDVSAAATNDPYVTPEPFVWEPKYPPPNSHYCMISRVSTTQHPNEIPNTGGYTDFAKWVAGEGGIGWRNVRVVANGSPEILFDQDYDQGDEEGLMDILITATNCPIGAEVWYSSGTALPDGGVIKIPPSEITEDRPQTFGTQAFIPAGWKTKFNGAYRSNGGPPRGEIEVSLRVQFAPEPRSELYELGSPIEELGFGNWHMFHEEKQMYLPGEEFYRATNSRFASGPVRPVVLGSFTAKGGA